MREAEMFIRADQAFTDVVAQIEDEQWDEIVPATSEWTIRELVNHVAHNNIVVTGGEAPDASNDVLGEDAASGWTELAEAAEEAAEEMSEAKAPMLAGQTCDRVIHLWDLTGALELDQTIDPKLAQFCYDFMLPNAEQLTSSDMFGPEVHVAADADVASKLLGLTGRDPEVDSDDIHTATGNSRSV